MPAPPKIRPQTLTLIVVCKEELIVCEVESMDKNFSDTKVCKNDKKCYLKNGLIQ